MIRRYLSSRLAADAAMLDLEMCSLRHSFWQERIIWMADYQS